MQQETIYPGVNDFFTYQSPKLQRSRPECLEGYNFWSGDKTGAPNDNFRKNICSEDDLRSRIFGTFVVKFLACLPLLGFSNI